MNSRIYAILQNGVRQEFQLPDIELGKDYVKATIKKEQLAGRIIEKIEFINDDLKIQAPREGYLFMPKDCASGCTLTYLTERKQESVKNTGRITGMAFAGLGGCENAIMVQVISGEADAFFEIRYTDSLYTLSVHFAIDGLEVKEDLTIIYTLIPNGTYSDMAKIYRKYQMEHFGFEPIRERVKNNPYLKYALESVEFRIRMGWKPVPTPVFRQNDENEPPLKVACDIPKLKKLTEALKKAGVDKAEICLVGWSKGGHDGRFPQAVPSEEAYGSSEEMKDYIRYAQQEGYQVVCHTGGIQAFEIADNFEIENMSFLYGCDGQPVPRISSGYLKNGGLCNGASYMVCPEISYEKYDKESLRKVKEYGFAGCHYIDELTAVEAYSCVNEKHAVNRRECQAYWKKRAKLASELFGGYQSEAWFNPNKHIDAVLYTSFNNKFAVTEDNLMDESIPLWQLVYHGIILSNASSTTVNYTMKGSEEHLYFIETASRPLMYLYSKFGEDKNWMGDTDLRCEEAGDEILCAEQIKKAYDEYLPLMHLQYEFMENHEKISEGVYQTTFSDGTKITVDYKNKCYHVNRQK